MIKVLICCVILSLISASGSYSSLEEHTFDDYILEFNKDYEKNSSEYHKRKQIFEAKLTHILEFNA